MKHYFIILFMFFFGYYSGFGQAMPAARLGDMTIHGGSIVLGYSQVLIGGMPAARLGDMHVCPMVTPGTPPIPHIGGPITTGSSTVLIGGMPAARVGDICVCAGPPDNIALGCTTVLIGEGIGSITEDEEILLSNLNDFNEENSSLKTIAIYQLGEKKSKKAINPLTDILLNDSSPEIRTLAAISLYKIGDKKGMLILKQAVEKETHAKVKQVCETLYQNFENIRN